LFQTSRKVRPARKQKCKNREKRQLFSELWQGAQEKDGCDGIKRRHK
jgi:hypothetical protein